MLRKTLSWKVFNQVQFFNHVTSILYSIQLIPMNSWLQLQSAVIFSLNTNYHNMYVYVCMNDKITIINKISVLLLT